MFSSIVVSLSTTINVISLTNFQTKATFSTIPKYSTRILVNESPLDTLLVYPDEALGNVCVASIAMNRMFKENVEKKSEIRILALNYDGSLLATASVNVSLKFIKLL